MKIISGGQTGADRTALEIARELGIPTGGFAPLGWRTDEGPDPSLAEFGLVEVHFPSYRLRTRANVRASHGTVIYGDTSSPGCCCTITACLTTYRPYLENPTPAELVDWIRAGQIEILNVAGNRRRTNPGIVAQVRAMLTPALRQLCTAARSVRLCSFCGEREDQHPVYKEFVTCDGIY
jgi:hypothetical protein